VLIHHVVSSLSVSDRSVHSCAPPEDEQVIARNM
jgi:hypothetical protein